MGQQRQQRRQQHQRDQQARPNPQRQHQPQAVQTPVPGHHQAAKPHHRRQRVHQDRTERRRAQPVPSPLPQRVVHHVHPAIHPDPHNQRQHNHVRRVEGDVEKAHHAKQQCRPHHRGQHRQQRQLQAAEIEQQHQQRRHQRIQPRFLVAALDGPRSLVGLQRCPRRLGIDRSHVGDELAQRFDVPDLLPRIDLQQPLLPI